MSLDYNSAKTIMEGKPNMNPTRVRRKRLAWMAAILVVILALGWLATHGPGDAELETLNMSPTYTSSTSTSAYVDWCHQDPDTLAWCEWYEWIQDDANREWWERVVAWVAARDAMWERLRECEAPDWAGGWQANTGNGYYGGLQFALDSWRGVGGEGYPHQQSRDYQIAMGERLLSAQGWGAWPSCSRELGYYR